ncbi:unnamed protein product, partial [Phaeothamnion confervicola]
YAAASYLRTWVVVDTNFVDRFSNNLTAESVAEILREYKVVRNFKKRVPEEGDERFQAFADVLIRQKASLRSLNQLNAVEIVTNINKDIVPYYQAEKHKNFVSAASKTAWMLCRDPVAIYDSLACGALRGLKYKFTTGDYESYYVAWSNFYKDKEVSIEAAAKWVASSDYASRLAAHGVATLRSIQEWSNQAWFKNRICDQRLVWLGSGDNLPLA